MGTIFDKIINIIVNNWWGAIIILLCIVLKNIPPITEGCKTVWKFFRHNKDFIIKYEDETITFDVKMRSRNYDIIKIHAITHQLGIAAENAWIRRYYPGYKHNMQILNQIETDAGKIIFDIIPISNGHHHKDIYFDITEFYEGAMCAATMSINDYVEHKIREIYKRENRQKEKKK